MSQIIQAGHATIAEDEITALKLHIEDVCEREESKKAKYPTANPPDLEIAYTIFLDGLRSQLQVLHDLKIAHSTANAVDLDGTATAKLSQEEAQDKLDRQLAVRLSDGELNFEAPPPYTEQAQEISLEDKLVRRLEDLHTWDDIETDGAAVAGPSQPCVRHQANILGAMSRKVFQCTACMDGFRWADATQLNCGHEYCQSCLKEVIMRGVKDHDLALIPPRCCGKPVIQDIIVNILSAEEMDDFQSAVTEKDTKDKTYCGNVECGKFVAPMHILAGKATCPYCKSQTCAICKGNAHEGDCPADAAIQATLKLGTENHWQRCFSCRSLVAIEWGCKHMTYVLPYHFDGAVSLTMWKMSLWCSILLPVWFRMDSSTSV